MADSILREARVEDISFLEEIYCDAFQERGHSRLVWTRWLPEIIVAERGGEIVGFACVGRDGYKRPALNYLAVDPRHQGQGVGRMLLEEAIRHGARHLCVLKKNRRAIRIYRKAGFVESMDPRDREDTQGILRLVFQPKDAP